jgi:hypothetical protein
MPKFEPTEEQRKTVERAAGFGLPQDKICQLVVSDRTGRPIDDDTLRRHFAFELERGMAVTQYKVASSLVDNALAGNVTAQIWYTKTQMGWKETQRFPNSRRRSRKSFADLAIASSGSKGSERPRQAADAPRLAPRRLTAVGSNRLSCMDSLDSSHGFTR